MTNSQAVEDHEVEHHSNADLFTGSLFGYLGSNISSLWQHFALDARFGAIIPTRRADSNGVLGQCFYTFGPQTFGDVGAHFKIPELGAVRLHMPPPTSFAPGYGMGRNRISGMGVSGGFETSSHRLSFNTARML